MIGDYPYTPDAVDEIAHWKKIADLARAASARDLAAKREVEADARRLRALLDDGEDDLHQ